MNNDKKLIPNYRFPAFKNDGNWEIDTIDNTCDILNNLRRPITSNNRKAGEFPYYGASGIIDYVDNYIYDEKLVLVGEDGAKWGSFENTAFTIQGKAWVNNHAHVLRPIKVNHEILDNYLKMIDLSKYITGAAPPKLTLGKLKTIELPFPSNPAVQQKIAACLSSLDDVIAGHEEKLTVLEEHKKGLMQNLFPQEGETQPKYRFPEFENDGDWLENVLDDVFNFVRGPFGGALKKDIFVKEGYAVYEQSHAIYSDFSEFRYYINSDKYKELIRFSVKPNDLIMSCSGTMGKFALVPENCSEGVINQALLKLSAKKGYSILYLKYLMETDLYQNKLLSQSAGGAI